MQVEDFCPEVLYSGGCRALPNCALKHDVRFCEVCGVICSPASNYAPHTRGQQHRQRTAALEEPASYWLTCPLCNVKVFGQISWFQHIAGVSHRAQAVSQGRSPLVLPLDPKLSNGGARCLLCKRIIPTEIVSAHLHSVQHRQMEQYAAYRSSFELAERNKRGVKVSHEDTGIDFGIVEVVEARRGIQVNIQVTMNTPSGSIIVCSAKAYGLSGTGASTPFRALAPAQGTLKLLYKQVLTIPIELRTSERGRYNGRVEVIFQDPKKDWSFLIARTVKATVGSKADYDRLKPSAPYTRRRLPPWRKSGEVVSSTHPPALGVGAFVRPLPKAEIPRTYAALLGRKDPAPQIARMFKAAHLPKTFDAMTHGKHFQALLWVEEFAQDRELRMYDMSDVHFPREGSLYRIEVPGLAEKRPSVIIGDIIVVQPSSTTNNVKTYEGRVHVVRSTTVLLGFHASFRPSPTQTFTVRFKYNRVVLRRQHEALRTGLPKTPQRLLVPEEIHAGLTVVPGDNKVRVQPVNPLVGANAAQMQAVRSILAMGKGAAPFIVFGPPGTGKTVTIVEAIHQILQRDPSAHILACAPSNSAADIIAQRLAPSFDPESKALIRLYALSRSPTDVPTDLLPYVRIRPAAPGTAAAFIPPSKGELLAYRVIVSTCCTASVVYGLGVTAGHFSHMFVDEAGQGSEPEVLAPLRTMMGAETRIVLSGDPKQLGPVVRSAVARELGFGISYLERVMKREVYNEKKQTGKTIVKLVKNFRSHPAILTYPNAQFYDNALEPCAPRAQTDAFFGSALLVNPKFPVVFHAIAGKDEREGTSPSYFNIDEISEVRERILQLLKDRKRPIQPRDIGVITPYFGQARRLRQELKRVSLDEVKVGSVEEFQGQERRVVFVSTVRSSRELLEYDLRHTLGFVANPQRFNVAMTRAQGLLYVVGDPAVLGLDTLWRGFLNYIHSNGGWKGGDIPWDPDAPLQEEEGFYAQEMREMGVQGMEEFARRVRETGGGEDEDEDGVGEEAEAGVEIAVIREEE